MDTSTLVLGLRVVLSLACVLGLLWFLGRRMSGSAAVRSRRETALAVVGRQSLGGRNGVALVEVAGRRLLLGVGEHGVTLLTEIEVPPVVEETPGRTVIDPAELELLVHGDPLGLAPEAVPAGTPTTAQDGPVMPTSTPAARMPAVPTPRNPLEGSILDATTWRRAVVAVQERTIRR